MQVRVHRHVTGPVHEHGGKIVMQILHAGRYAYHPFNVAPSAIRVGSTWEEHPCLAPLPVDGRREAGGGCVVQAPINRFKPRALSSKEVEQTIQDYARCASLAKEAG